MKNILDENLIQNQYFANRQQLFYYEIKKYAIWIGLLFSYLFLVNLAFQNSPLNIYKQIPFNYLFINTLLIYAMVSCIFGLFIAAFEYKSFNYTQRFFRATVMLMTSILFIIAAMLTFLVIVFLLFL